MDDGKQNFKAPRDIDTKTGTSQGVLDLMRYV